MDKLTHWINRFFGSDDISKDHRYFIFLIFLGISVILWFFAALNEEYTGEVSYPVNYINLPQDKILVNDLPNKLTIIVEAKGYTLLRYRLGAKLKPIVYNLQRYYLRKVAKGTPSRYYLLTAPAKNMIEAQMGNKFRVLELRPDTLFFQFTEMIAKRVPIIPDIKIGYEKPFRVHGQVILEPDSIIITGPDYILDTLTFITTRYYEFSGIDKSFSKTIQLKPIKQVTFPRKRVEMQIPVEEYTENSFDISITKVNVPDSLELILFPEKVKMVYMVALCDYDKVDPRQFEVSVDFMNLDASGLNRARVALVRYPDFVQNVVFSPISVEYLKEKK